MEMYNCMEHHGSVLPLVGGEVHTEDYPERPALIERVDVQRADPLFVGQLACPICLSNSAATHSHALCFDRKQENEYEQHWQHQDWLRVAVIPDMQVSRALSLLVQPLQPFVEVDAVGRAVLVHLRLRLHHRRTDQPAQTPNAVNLLIHSPPFLMTAPTNVRGGGRGSGSGSGSSSSGGGSSGSGTAVAAAAAALAVARMARPTGLARPSPHWPAPPPRGALAGSPSSTAPSTPGGPTAAATATC